jgi:hypothetical protein
MWRRKRPSHQLPDRAGPAASRKSLHFRLSVQASSSSASSTQGRVISLQASVGISIVLSSACHSNRRTSSRPEIDGQTADAPHRRTQPPGV